MKKNPPPSPVPPLNRGESSMDLALAGFDRIVAAEEYFEFFQLPYEQSIVNVNRLHILKKFSQYITEINENNPDLSESEKLEKYREALKKAYEVFLTQTPLETKLFKVFTQKPNNVVMLTDIKT